MTPISKVPIGEESGMFGLAPRGNDYAFRAIGEYEYYDESGSGPYIWNTPIASPGFAPYDFVFSYDGVAGYTSGIWKDGSMGGYSIALLSRYDDETRHSSISALSRDRLQASTVPRSPCGWREGMLITDIREVGIDPEEYELYGDWGNFDEITSLLEAFRAAGISEGYSDGGHTYFFGAIDQATEIDISYPWGLYTLHYCGHA